MSTSELSWSLETPLLTGIESSYRVTGSSGDGKGQVAKDLVGLAHFELFPKEIEEPSNGCELEWGMIWGAWVA